MPPEAAEIPVDENGAPAPDHLPPVDETLATLEAQVRTLTAQRTLLTTRLLSLKKTHPLLTNARGGTSTSPPSTPNETSFASVTSVATSNLVQQSTIPDIERLTDSQILRFSLERSKALTRHAVTCLHRVAGVTAFTVKDPSASLNSATPNTTNTATTAGDEEKLLGLRVEVFTQKHFQNPHYVLLTLESSSKSPSNQYFAVARHSIPTFLHLPQLSREFLPQTSITHQHLQIFAKKLRARVLRYYRRLNAVEEMKDAAIGAKRIGDVMEKWTQRVEGVEWDLPVEIVTIRWMNGTTAWCKVEESGVARKVVVKDKVGRRKGDVEGMLKGGLAGVARRIGWVPTTTTPTPAREMPERSD